MEGSNKMYRYSIIVSLTFLAGCEGSTNVASESSAVDYNTIASCLTDATVVNALNIAVTRTGKLHISEIMDMAYAVGKAEGMAQDAIQADLRARFNTRVEPVADNDVSDPSSEYGKVEVNALQCAAKLVVK